MRILKPGRAQGVVYGGCLSILTFALGTRFAPQTEGKLLFIEDVAAKPYQIDRMLRQMLLAGKFDGVTGLIFGEMLECASPGTGAGSAGQVILRVFDWFEGPIAIGLRSGHVSRSNVTLPLGIEAELILEDEPVLQLSGAGGAGLMQDADKHIHLIGICGTAMASLAGLLQLKGHRVTGSDQAAYPPMSDLLRSLNIPVAEPFSEENLDPRPDLVIVGNAMSRGNVELEYVLDQRIPFTSWRR